MGSFKAVLNTILFAMIVFTSFFVYHYHVLLPTIADYEKKFYIIDFEQLSAVRALDTMVRQSKGELVINGAADVAKMAEGFRQDFLKALKAEVGNAPVFAKNTVVTAENFEDLTVKVASRMGLIIDEEKLKEILFFSSASKHGMNNITLPDKIIDEEAFNIFTVNEKGEVEYNESYLIREFGTTDLSKKPYEDPNRLSFEKF